MDEDDLVEQPDRESGRGAVRDLLQLVLLILLMPLIEDDIGAVWDTGEVSDRREVNGKKLVGGRMEKEVEAAESEGMEGGKGGSPRIRQLSLGLSTVDSAWTGS